MITKRNVLKVLGLASTAVGVSDFANANLGREKPSPMSFGPARPVDYAAALRKLADDVERGNTYPQSIELTSSAKLEEFVHHRLSIEFIMAEQAES